MIMEGGVYMIPKVNDENGIGCLTFGPTTSCEENCVSMVASTPWLYRIKGNMPFRVAHKTQHSR